MKDCQLFEQLTTKNSTQSSLRLSLSNCQEKTPSNSQLQVLTTSDQIVQDLIKQLTYKNKLLSAQLAQYKVLVGNLQNKIVAMSQQQQQLRLMNEQNELKLHTISQEMSNIQNTASSNKNKEKKEIQVIELSQMLQAHQVSIFDLGWQDCLRTIQRVLKSYRELSCFRNKIAEMKDMIEPGRDDSVVELWEWLRKIGINYNQLKKWEHSAINLQANNFQI